jgi:hypothetical protein
MFTKRISTPMIMRTVTRSTMEVAEAEGYCSRAMSLEISRPTLALCEPDMNRTVMKSPITSVSTKMVPIMIPGLESGMITLRRICQSEAPLSRAASIRERSMRIIVLKIGVIMNRVLRCTKASSTAKSE